MSKPQRDGALLARLAALAMIVSTSVIFQACKSAAPPDDLSAAPVDLRWTPDATDPNKVVVEVHGLSAAALERLQRLNWPPPQWQRLLSVYAEPPGLTPDLSLPPMLGAYRVQANVLRFEPQFPLEPEVSYRAVFQPGQMPGEGGSDGTSITSVFQPPRNSTPDTTVSHVYPSGDLLPENLLKFYVHFSAPMSRGRIYDHIHLRTSGGQEIELPFLELDEELWDPTMTRLTLIIDPGRIKRGVRPLEDIGPVLEAGKSYALVIDRKWQDGAGKAIKESFEKSFKVRSADRQPPDPNLWKIVPPSPDTRQPLTVIFPEPMDHAVTQRVIQVTGESGDPIDGNAALEDQERRWTFVPKNLWNGGAYKLVIQTSIEDLAGNNIGKPFDVDLFEGTQKRQSLTTVTLAFNVR
jgi:hypothetical protein